ncbi:MAG: endonuclease MutS2 [Candidatus Gastranaerophilales bacterium]|nr:endonuclease MutS2 [Candidatus Gastranaerophilales bacterium]
MKFSVIYCINNIMLQNQNEFMNLTERTLKALEWQTILQELSKRATSVVGKEKCANAEFFTDIDRIKIELSYTTEAKYILDVPQKPPFGGIRDVRESLQLCNVGQNLKNAELIDIANTIKASRLIKSFLARYQKETSHLFSFSTNLFEDKQLENAILDIFDETGNILDTASIELKRLTTALKDNIHNLKSKLNSLLNSSSFQKYLQESVYTQRDGRYVFPVKVDFKASVPGIVHDISASGATLFIEPKSIVEMNNRIREIEILTDKEIKRILAELSQLVREKVTEITYNIDLLAEIDFIFAKAQYSVDLKATEPNLNEKKIISLKNARHPILSATIEKVVPNDFEIGITADSMIITGSNTGGKTVMLKTAGLSVLMTKAGLHIPVDEADIYPFERIFADIGDEQSLVQSLSTFSGHMTHIINVLNNSNDKTLVLLDEIGAGTDPSEGSALAQAILEGLKEKGAITVVTTHYGELKALAYIKKRYENASVEFNTETLSPTYKLLIGIPGKSNAITIAQNLGLSANVAENALNIYHTQKDPSGKVMEGLQLTQQKLSKNVEETKIAKKEAVSLEQEYKEKLEKLRTEKTKTVDVFKKKFNSEIHKAKEEIKEILNEIRASKSEKIARRSLSRLGKIESRFGDLASQELEEIKPEYKNLNKDEIKIGDIVLVKNLDQEAEILSLPDKNDNIQVAVGNLKTTIKLSKLAKSKKRTKKVIKSAISYEQKGFAFRRTNISNKLDLRGKRVEEGLDELENYLDDASLANLSPITIIHGHGTGAMKEAVREYLKTSPYVAKFRAGEKSEGGDGATIIDLV